MSVGLRGEGDARQRLTAKMREAIRLTELRGYRYANDPNFYTPITSEATFADAYTCWLNYRTAAALERRGYGRVQGVVEECEFVLLPERERPRG